ncbi:hypothetical protein B0O80DRAFT_127242 [Mortierella sp. GBAus27b]|nr:hypothetical protein BGX31_001911 [Mortierella sp. GBA43]KAI8350808.1 hypothetical protein B0O80DRAFT_127242 [Mortierella sp. GBAus27b]
MAGNSNNMHEVHLTNHPGYDLLNSHDFLYKYGPYLLTMMHMVKYGIKTCGLLVPPLLNLRHMSNADMDQGHLSFEKQNIGRLVDDTIACIEEAISARNNDSNTATHHCLSALELEQIVSHLDVEHGIPFTSDMCRITTLDRRVWVCDDHWSIEAVMNQLKSIITKCGGACFNNKVNIKLDKTFETLAKQFKDIIAQLSMSQKPTGGFINYFNGIKSLSIDSGTLSMTIYGISHGTVKDAVISIKRISDLKMDDLEFIRQCRPVMLKIMHTPREEDEDRLVNILEHNITIAELHIGCNATRAFAVINLVISTRNGLLDCGSQPLLQTFQVMNDGLTSLDLSILKNYEGVVTATVSFTEGSATVVMEPHIKLQTILADADNTAVSDFIRQYGGSIETLVIPDSFSDSHAEQLYAVISKEGSRVTTVAISPTSLTTRGLDVIDRVIKRTKRAVTIRLFLNNLHEEDQLKKALLLLKRYKDRLIGLRLNGGSRMKELLQIMQAFPTRDKFPQLEELTIDGQNASWFTEEGGEWIISMVSAPSPPLKRLKFFCMLNTYSYWPMIFDTMDLSALEVMSFNGSDFYGKDTLIVLVKRIADGELPLRLLDLSGCYLHCPEDGTAMYTMLRKNAPYVEIVGMEKYAQ